MKPNSPLHFDGFEIEDMISTTQRLRAMTDQSAGRLLTWIVIGNAASVAFCMTQLVKQTDIETIWMPLIISSWCFAIGLILGVSAAFCFARAMSEYSLHSQEVLRGMRGNLAPKDLSGLGLKHIENGNKASVIVGYASTFSACLFVIGLLGALWAATNMPPLP